MQIIVLVLILLNLIFSYKGFRNQLFFQGYKFEVDRILLNKDYIRLVTSGFLHGNWTHLLFNMYSLYVFGARLEATLGGLNVTLIYFISLILGNLLSLYVHRFHGDYSAVGASGAICGVIFASVALFPTTGIRFLFLPFSIPGWLYGILYIGYSIYSIKSNNDNIGHEAHLGGALAGLLIAIVLWPSSLQENYLTILLIAVPALAFIYLIITRPHFLIIDNFSFQQKNKFDSIDHKFNENKANKAKELDQLLEKISRKGLKSLSQKEKKKLDEYSK